MKREVRFTRRAKRDVDETLEYLNQRSPQGAKVWLRRWEEVLKELGHSAHRYPLAPEDDHSDKEIRQIVFNTRGGKPYRVLFTILSDSVFVMHLRGPGQDLVPIDKLQTPE